MEFFDYDFIHMLYKHLDYKAFLRMFMLAKKYHDYHNYLDQNNEIYRTILRSVIANSNTHYGKLNTVDFEIKQLQNLGRIQYCDNDNNFIKLKDNVITLVNNKLMFLIYINNANNKLHDLGDFIKIKSNETDLEYANAIRIMDKDGYIYLLHMTSFNLTKISGEKYITICDFCQPSYSIDRNLSIPGLLCYDFIACYDYGAKLSKFGELFIIKLKIEIDCVIKICLIKHILLILDKKGNTYYINMNKSYNISEIITSNIIDIKGSSNIGYFVMTKDDMCEYKTCDILSFTEIVTVCPRLVESPNIGEYKCKF
jgi:hypothetical protein